jgi:hypothetical protein
MKALVIAITVLASGFAFAKTSKHHRRHAKDCNPYIVSVGEGPGEYVYPCGENYEVTYRTCNEGEVGYFHVGDSSNGGQGSEERRVCHNGTFYPGYSEPAHRGCNEGEVAYSTEMGSGGEYVQVTVVCQNGRFVRR